MKAKRPSGCGPTQVLGGMGCLLSLALCILGCVPTPEPSEYKSSENRSAPGFVDFVEGTRWVGTDHVRRLELDSLEQMQIPADSSGTVLVGLYYIPRPTEFVAVESIPEIAEKAELVYPPEALSSKREAVIWVTVLVWLDGTAMEAIIEKGSDTSLGFNESALRAAMETRYRPATRSGEPVISWLRQRFDFVPPK